MRVSEYLRRHSVLFVEAIVFTGFVVLTVTAVSMLQDVGDASPDAGGMAAIGALIGLVLLFAGVSGGVLALCGAHLYRRWQGVYVEPYGRALVFVIAVVAWIPLGLQAFSIWAVGTGLYLWAMCVYRWWHPIPRGDGAPGKAAVQQTHWDSSRPPGRHARRRMPPPVHRRRRRPANRWRGRHRYQRHTDQRQPNRRHIRGRQQRP